MNMDYYLVHMGWASKSDTERDAGKGDELEYHHDN